MLLRSGGKATAGKPRYRRRAEGCFFRFRRWRVAAPSDSSCHAARAASASSLRRSIGFVTPAAASAESSKRPAISAALVTPACSSSGSRCARPERTRNCAGGRPAVVDKGEWWVLGGGPRAAGWVHWQCPPARRTRGLGIVGGNHSMRIRRRRRVVTAPQSELGSGPASPIRDHRR